VAEVQDSLHLNYDDFNLEHSRYLDLVSYRTRKPDEDSATA
jgi:hypothetical protein